MSCVTWHLLMLGQGLTGVSVCVCGCVCGCLCTCEREMKFSLYVYMQLVAASSCCVTSLIRQPSREESQVNGAGQNRTRPPFVCFLILCKCL